MIDAESYYKIIEYSLKLNNIDYNLCSFEYRDKFSMDDLRLLTAVGNNFSGAGDAFGISKFNMIYFADMSEGAKDDFKRIFKNSNRSDVSYAFDYRFIKEDWFLELISNKLSFIKDIQIIGDDYELNQNDYHKLRKYFPYSYIQSKKVCEELKNEYMLLETNGLFCFSGSLANGQPVLDSFVLENLDDDKLYGIVEKIKNVYDDSSMYELNLNVRFYNPVEYRDFLLKLKRINFPSDVTINFLGGPLYDQSQVFENLRGIVPNRITVTYNTCKDMLDQYCSPPYLSNQYYDSEIEGGGIVDLDGYIDTLKIIEEQEKHVKAMGYSPLEACLYFYNYLQNNHYYDPDSDYNDDIDYRKNRDIDRVIGNKKLVCVGYGNLYSLMLRRCGIPMFRYSTTGHVRNVGRIRDEKYDFDMIGVCDPTWDGAYVDDKGNVQSRTFPYKHFMMQVDDMLKVKDDKYVEHFTIPSSLVIGDDHDFFGSSSFKQRNMDPNYSPNGYTYTMLQLMGYEVNSVEDFYKIKDELNKTSVLKIRDERKYKTAIKEALETVFRKEKANFVDLLKCFSKFDSSYSARKADYGNSVSRLDFNITDEGFKDVQIIDDYYDRTLDEQYRMIPYLSTKHVVRDSIVDDVRNEEVVDESYISGTNIPKPRLMNIDETEEEYAKYLEQYYTYYFPKCNKGLYSKNKDDIIQDLGMYSTEEQIYNASGMTDEEILASQRKIGR